MTRNRVYWALALALAASSWIATAIVYAKLPATIPIHWNIHGKVDGYGTKATLLLVPIATLGFLGFFRCLSYLSPKGYEVDTFRSTMVFVMVCVVALFVVMQGVILLVTWQTVARVAHPIDIGRVLFANMFLFLALIGNQMGKIRRNFYIGVRTPWTLASERVWNDTHRLAAWSMVVGSLIGFLLVVAGLSLLLAFAVLIVSAMIPVVYSFVHYKQVEKQEPLDQELG